jgi:hypothetical protein
MFDSVKIRPHTRPRFLQHGKFVCGLPGDRTDGWSRSRTGRKGPYAAYYVQIKPNGGSVVGKELFHS